MSNETLLLEQVKDLEKRTKSAIKSGNHALTYSLVMEHSKLINRAIGNTGSNNEILHELLLLTLESTTIPLKSKDDPLVQLKWLDNSIPKLMLLVRKLIPDTEIDIGLHREVLKVAGKKFQDGYYSEAVFAAFKSLEAYVKRKSGVKKRSGTDLMAHVFNVNNPILKIKYSHTDTATEEQEGFRLIFMGAMLGIRNPKAHYEIFQKDRVRTVQYLALVSLLFKTVDDATLASIDCLQKT